MQHRLVPGLWHPCFPGNFLFTCFLNHMKWAKRETPWLCFMQAGHAALVGALRREEAASRSIKRLERDVEALQDLLKQRDMDAQRTKMIIRLKEDKVARLQVRWDPQPHCANTQSLPAHGHIWASMLWQYMLHAGVPLTASRHLATACDAFCTAELESAVCGVLRVCGSISRVLCSSAHDKGATLLVHHDSSTSRAVSCSLQGASGPLRGTTAEADAELEALRNERALLIDKLNNHPDVRKYAGVHLMPLAESERLYALSVNLRVTSGSIIVKHRLSAPTVRSSLLQ